MEFRISSTEKQTRSRNLYFSSLFSGLLILLLWTAIPGGMQELNSILAKFAILFLVAATGFKWYKHIKYISVVETHKVVVEKGRALFWQSGKVTELKLDKIHRLIIAHRNGKTHSLKVQLKNGRNIHLKGYTDMEALSEIVARQLPPDTVEEKS